MQRHALEPDAAGGGNTGGGRFVPDSDAAASEGGAGSDLLKSLKAGAQKLPGQITGLLDIPAALTSGDRPISRAADWVGEKTGFQPGKWARDTKFSPGYDASRAAVDETWKPVEAVAADPNTSKADVVRAFADNLPQILKGYGANPMYSLNQVAESLPGMVAGGVLSRGLMTAGRAAGAGTGALEGVAGKWAAPIAGGVGEGAQQAGQVMDEFQGQDQRKAAIAALASGGLDALIAAGGGRVANRLGLETPRRRWRSSAIAWARSRPAPRSVPARRSPAALSARASSRNCRSPCRSRPGRTGPKASRSARACCAAASRAALPAA